MRDRAGLGDFRPKIDHAARLGGDRGIEDFVLFRRSGLGVSGYGTT